MQILRIYLILLCFTPLITLGQGSGLINAFPYSEGFETGQGNWNSGGINNDWTWGSPSKTVINNAGAGTKCWITGGLTTSFYNYGERAWIESPCFDFSSLQKPFISFLLFWDTEYIYDGANLQYTINGGATWTTIGTSNDPAQCGEQNWYNYNRINGISQFGSNAAGWCGTVTGSFGSCRGGNGSGQWLRAAKCVSDLAGQPDVKFRFTFGSGTTCNDFDGFAFDDFTIQEGGPTFAADFSFNCQSSNSLQFLDNSSTCNIRWSWDFNDGSTPVTNSNPSHQFANPGVYNVTMTTGGKCSGDTFITKQVRIMGVELNATPVSCDNGNDGTLTTTVLGGSGAETFSWLGRTDVSPVLINQPVGIYQVSVTDLNACTVTRSVEIIYGPDAFPIADLGKDTILCPGTNLLLHPGKFDSYVWDDLSTDSIRKINSGGNYFVEISNSAGCRAMDSILITEDCLNDLLIPNSFTPNGDGINDNFIVQGSETESFKIYIYNRWGNLIFESSDRLNGWNGQWNGKGVPEGIYIYKVLYKTFYSQERERTGSIFVNY